MSKAFDRVEWKFLISVMSRMGFCDSWCSLILQCISTTEVSVLLNGSPCSSFCPSRGIRQGDPISPSLFIIAMEAFSRGMLASEATNQLQGVKIAEKAPAISHILFADDCLVFVRANNQNIFELQDLLGKFSSCSGQLLNFQKSSISFSKNLSEEACEHFTNVLGVQRMDPNERYLGIPLILNRKKKVSFSFLVSNMERRLTKWRGKMQAQAGRSVMVKTVLNTIPLHQMYNFKLPVDIIKKLDSIQLHFWWDKPVGQGLYLTSWQNLCRSIPDGGLNFRDLALLNRALLAKTAWRLCTTDNTLWAEVLAAKYFKDERPMHSLKKSDATWSWKCVYAQMEFIKTYSFWSLGDGKKILMER